MNLRHIQLARPALGHSRTRTAVALLALVGGTLATAALLITALVATGLDGAVAGVAEAPGPAVLAVTLLAVPVLTLPAALLTARFVLGLSPGEVCSVTGRFRVRWYLRCLLAAAVVAAGAAALSLLGSTVAGPPPDGWLLLAVLVCCVPVQSFAEEFTFRGVLAQIVGARWAGAGRAVCAAGVVSAVLFALAHGQLAPGPFVAHVLGGLVYAVLCDRTGGLEASAAAHTAWNLALLGSVTLLGVPAAGSSGIGVLVGAVAIDVVLAAVLVALARRTGIAQGTTPGRCVLAARTSRASSGTSTTSRPAARSSSSPSQSTNSAGSRQA